MSHSLSAYQRIAESVATADVRDRPDTTLETVRNRLEAILARAGANFDHLSLAGDRAYGAEISGVGGSEGKATGPTGVVDEIFSLLSRLDAVNSATTEQVERIERLV
ncbi:hypothetical protein [Azospirillum sp. TSO5]|uniref:hypothetical protein n=1 Tax=Azospirillum sp. TSO5 TaxID=716760 RepID=UPI0011B1F978|nr:hypothetical protein [Azospirillum sp. TSO5]